MPGNPAGAELARVGDVPVPIVAGQPDGFFNYVATLGVDRPATGADVAAVAAIYASRSQASWFVTVGPTRASRDLPDLLRLHGLQHGVDFAKVVRSTKDVPAATCDLRVEQIGPESAAAFAAINLAAWALPSTLEGWFSRCVGRPGWHHYACFDDDVVVATGAIFVRGEVGWLSWAATAPSHRGRGAQSALISRRIRDAADLGCSIVHAEVYDEPLDDPSPSLRNLLRTGFQLAYRRPSFGTLPVHT